MRFLFGLVAVAALALVFITLGVNEDDPVKGCPHCSLKSLTAYKKSLGGGETLWSCSKCFARFRQDREGGPLIAE